MGGVVALVGGPPNGITLTDVWPLLAVIFTGAAGVFGYMVKHTNDVEAKNKELTDKLINEVVPTLTENTIASKAMIDATVRLQSALAVAEDRQKGRSTR